MFRVTGVVSVIGGWFITAVAAFISAGVMVGVIHPGGVPVMIAGGLIAIVLLLRNNLSHKKEQESEEQDSLFQTILSTDEPKEVWQLMIVYIHEKQRMFLDFATSCFDDVTQGFMTDSTKLLARSEKNLVTEKEVIKSQRRKLTLCLRKVNVETAMEKRAWFHLSNNMAMSMTYNLRHINEVCKEHVDNNFRPLPEHLHQPFTEVCTDIKAVLKDAAEAVEGGSPEEIDRLRNRCSTIKDRLSFLTRDVYDLLQKGDTENMTVAYVYLNVLQETQEFITSFRKMLRAIGKLNLAPSSYRSFSTHMAQ